MSDNLKKVYSTLQREGYELPKYEEFEADMRDDKLLGEVRQTLVNAGYTPPEFDEFKFDMWGTTPAPTDKSQYTFTGQQLGLEPEEDDMRSMTVERQTSMPTPMWGTISVGENRREAVKDLGSASSGQGGISEYIEMLSGVKSEGQEKAEEQMRIAKERAARGERNWHPYGDTKKPLIESPDIRIGAADNVGLGSPSFNAEIYADEAVRRAEEGLKPADGWTEATKRAQANIASKNRQAQIKKAAEDAVGEMMSKTKNRLNTALERAGAEFDSNYRTKVGDVLEGFALSGDPIKGASVTRRDTYINADDEVRTLTAARSLLNQTEKMVDDYLSRSDWGIYNIGRSAAKAAFDPATWDMGFADVDVADKLLSVVEKADKDEPLSESEQLLLDAAINQQVMQWYYGELTAGQKAGKMFGESLPFMAQIAMNPLGSMSKYAGSKAAKAVLKHISKKVSKKAIERILARTAGLTAQTLGDLGTSYGMALTSNLGNTTADALNRQIGDIQYDFDDNGVARYNGRLNVKEAGEAWLDAANNQAFEFYSEQMGNYFAPILKGMGKLGGKALKNFGMDGVNRWVSDFAKKGSVRQLNQFFDKTQFHGFAGEYAEEIANGMLNAAFVGDMTMEDVFSKDNLVDTAIGLSVMGAIGPMVGTAGYARAKYKEKQALNEADEEGRRLMGHAWDSFADAVRRSKNGEELSANLRETLNSFGRKALPGEDMRQILSYAQAYNRYKAVEEVSAAAVAEGVMDERDLELQRQYEKGQTTTDKHGLRVTFEAAADAVKDVIPLNIGDNTAYDIADEYDEQGDADTATAIRVFLSARAAHSGMTAQIREQAQSELESANAEIDSHTNKTDGNIYSVTLSGGLAGYVTGGTVITDSDGGIDIDATREANEGGYIYVNVDGVVKPKSVDDFVSLDGVESAADAKAAREAEINAALNAQYEELTAPVETQEAAPASTEVTPESASNEVAENAARALGLSVDELNDAIKDPQKGLAIAANYDRVDDTDSADAIRAYVAERFGTPAVQPAQVNNAAAAEVGNNGVENIPAEQAPENVAPVLSPEQQRKAKRAEIAARIPTKGKNKLWTQAKAEDVVEYIATLTDDAAVQQATADRYIADIKEKQAKMDAIEALELNDDIAFWERVKGLLAPVETQAEEGATAQAPEVIPAPTAENEMQPVAEVTEQPLSVESKEAGEPVGNSEQLNQSGDNTEMGNNNALNPLQNSNNELNLQQENVSDNESNQNDTPVGGQVSESVPQGEHGTNSSQVGGAQEAAARLRERIESAQRNSKSGLREIENRVTREFAQENGLWIENEFKLGTPFPSGDEHNNYIDTENQVIYKVNNRMHTPSILDLLDRIELHNKLFPNTQYRLVGFTAVSKNGDVMPVFAQDFVPDARMADVDEIDGYMGMLGFTRVGDGRYSNGETVIKDLKPRNVLADSDGDIYVVDAEFEQEKTQTAPSSGENTQNEGEKDVVEEMREQNRIAEEREQRAGVPPRVSDYSTAINAEDTEAQKAWEDKFNDFLAKLTSDDLPTIDSTISSMQGNKEAIKDGDPGGYKENPNYKAFDYIEKALKKRKRELEQSSTNGEKSQEIEDNSTNAETPTISQKSEQVSDQVEKNLSWEEMSAQERMNYASKNPLTIDEIKNSTSDEVNKSNAIAYISGTENLITQLSYLKVYEDVRIRPTDSPSDNGDRNETQLAETNSGESANRGAGGESGNIPLSVSETGSGKTPSIANVGENSEGGSDSLSGERGDSDVRAEESSMDGIPAGNNNSAGSRRGGRNGSNGRRTGRRNSSENIARGGEITPQSNAELIDDELNNALSSFKDTLSEFVKAGKDTLSISLTGLNGKQLEILPKLINEGTKIGYILVKKGLNKLAQWSKAMKSYIGQPLSNAGLSDAEVDAFIDELWNSRFPIGDEIHTIGEWASIIGMEETRKAVRASILDKKAAQDAAESVNVKIADAENITETLPFLLPQQQEDVLKAETQFFDRSHNDREHAFGKGYMFTNGTGTGKTYTGLGIVKRFIKQGKGRILIVTPSQQKVTDWISDAKNLNISLRSLDEFAKQNGTTATQAAGEGAVITTYANFRENAALLEGVFDLVVYDESHRLLENKTGTETRGVQQHYMITNRDEDAAFMRLREINPVYKKIREAQEKFISIYEKEIENKSQKNVPRLHTPLSEEYRTNFPKLYKAKEAYNKAEQAWGKEELKLREQAKKDAAVTKVVFLSATPFNTRDNLDYAERYIFMYPKENTETIGSYRHQSPKTRFYLEHFGGAYKFRYGRLENAPQNADVIARQEVAFSDYLQNTLNTMSGRVIDSEYDYSRDFPTVSLEMGPRINSAIDSITEIEELRPLWSARNKVWRDYNYSSALFETMKVSAMVPRLKQHLEKGRKIVIFHRRTDTKEPITPPFKLMMSIAEKELKETQKEDERKKLASAIRKFKKDNADLFEWEQTLNYSMPREQLAEAFGKENVLFFSGKESAKAKNEAVKQFNDDNSGKNIIVIQEASGKEGISLHDRTGEHQRVVITLALPQSPITALQIEGRIYRIGNKSNAIFEYPILGLNSEIVLFGQNFNNSVSTTENLALGSKARSLRSSFARGIEERSGDISVDEQGIGGKEADANTVTENDPFDNAVLDYYTNQKITTRRDNREGIDYYPTPEPLGFMMNIWGRVKDSDDILEPSAGHGAIARYVPMENALTAVEPSQSLFARLQIKAGGAAGRSFVNDVFENYNIINKHDVILMNPPFGVQGKLASEHVAKAYKHLNEGGRIVAIVPEGKAQSRIEKWLGEQKDAVVVGEVLLPDVTFVQAGTSIRCRVLVIDKISNEAKRNNAATQKITHNLGYVESIDEFFDTLRNINMPDRTIDTQLIMEKKVRRYASDLRGIKGVKEVYVNPESVVVRTKGWRNFNIVWGDLSGNALKKSLAQQYSQFAKKIPYADETSQEIMKELQGIICKLANMTEDEMERFIANPMQEDDTLYRSDNEVPRLTKHRVEKIFGGIWIDDAEEFAKFASAVNNSPFEEDGEGIAFTDNYFYAYYLNIDGQVIPFASVYLNSLESQEVVNQVNQEIKDGRREKGVKEYIDRAVIRARSLESQDNADNGNNRSTPNRGRNDSVDSNISRKGRYYDRPSLYVKTQRGTGKRNQKVNSEIISAVNKLAAELHTDVEIVNEVSSIPDARKRGAKGWYDGHVYLVLPNATSVDDAVETVLHEVVGHKGLRALFGERFNEMLDNVFASASKEVREAILKRAMPMMATGKDALRVATEEYMAEQAERGFDDYSFFDKVKGWILKLLRSIGLKSKISDSEIRYMLWRSYNLLRGNNVLAEIENIAMQARLGVGEYRTRGEVIDANHRDTSNAQEQYNKNVEGFTDRVKEAWIDNTRSVKKMQEAIEKETGNKIADYANVYLLMNQMPGRVREKMDKFLKKHLDPLGEFLKEMFKNDYLKGSEEQKQKQVERYLNCKHGIERNIDMSVRAALTNEEGVLDRKTYEQYTTEKEAIWEKNLPWAEEVKELTELSKKYNAKENDYSGLTALFPGEDSYQKIRSKAIKRVEDFENAFDKKVIDELWKRVGDINELTLKESYKSGLLSNDLYSSIKRQFKYYVPLRGFEETTADEVYEYLSREDVPISGPIRRAEGRKSEAEKIFATMANMYNSAVSMGAKNRIKQALYQMAVMNKTSLLSVNPSYYKEDGRGGYEPFLPSITDNMSEDEIRKEMEKYEEDVKKGLKDGTIKRHREGLNIDYKSEKWQRDEHAVRVKRNGKEFVVFVNGSPRVAQAVNGLLDKRGGKFIQTLQAANRWRARNITGYNVNFTLSNLARDIQEATVTAFAKEGIAYTWKFEKELMKNLAEFRAEDGVKYRGIHNLYYRYFRDKLDLTDKREKYFKEFMENGGETGFHSMMSIEDYQKRIKKAVDSNLLNATGKGFAAINDTIEFVNRGIENACRFATYVASRESGKSIMQSVNDAKEASVNFNRVGSGAMGNLFFRASKMFLNPAIQGLVKRLTLLRDHPVRMTPIVAMELLTGYIVGDLAMMAMKFIWDALGFDDDDEENNAYYNLSDFVRRSNVIIPLVDGKFIKIPLSHESRVAHGIGEILSSYMNGHLEYENIPAQVYAVLTQAIPLNPTAPDSFTDENLLEDIAKILIPDAFALPAYEALALNRDFTGRRITGRSDYNEHRPEYMRAGKGTPEFFIEMSRTINDWTGGSDIERGVLENAVGGVNNPTFYEYMLIANLGGIATITAQLYKTAQAAKGNEEYQETRNYPVINRFFEDTSSYEEEPQERTRRDYERAYRFFKEKVKDYSDVLNNYNAAENMGIDGLEDELEDIKGEKMEEKRDAFKPYKQDLDELYDDLNEAKDKKDRSKITEIEKDILEKKIEAVKEMEKEFSWE